MQTNDAPMSDSYRPAVIQNVMWQNALRFTSKPRNKRHYRRWISEKGLIRQIEESARVRWWRRPHTSFPVHMLNHNVFSEIWNEMVHRNIKRCLVPKGFVVKYRQFRGGPNTGPYTAPCIEWSDAQKT